MHTCAGAITTNSMDVRPVASGQAAAASRTAPSAEGAILMCNSSSSRKSLLVAADGSIARALGNAAESTHSSECSGIAANSSGSRAGGVAAGNGMKLPSSNRSISGLGGSCAVTPDSSTLSANVNLYILHESVAIVQLQPGVPQQGVLMR